MPHAGTTYVSYFLAAAPLGVAVGFVAQGVAIDAGMWGLLYFFVGLLLMAVSVLMWRMPASHATSCHVTPRYVNSYRSAPRLLIRIRATSPHTDPRHVTSYGSAPRSRPPLSPERSSASRPAIYCRAPNNFVSVFFPFIFFTKQIGASFSS